MSKHLLSEKLAGFLIKAYDIGPLKSIDSPVSRGNLSRYAIITTDRGKFFIKERNPMYNISHIQFDHELIDFLLQHEFNTPRLIPDRNGRKLVTLKRHFFELFEYIPGGKYKHGSDPHMRSVARTLARYHRLVENFSTEIIKPFQTASYFIHDQTSWASGPCPFEDIFRRMKKIFGDRYEKIRPLVVRIEACFRVLQIKMRYVRSQDLTRLVIHGDYQPRNLLFKNGRVAAVTDFDCATTQERMVDVARALMGFAMNKSLAHLVIEPSDLDRMRRFLDDYQESCPLTRYEMEFLPLLLLSTAIGAVAWWLRYGEPKHVPAALRVGLPFIYWFEDNQTLIDSVLKG